MSEQDSNITSTEDEDVEAHRRRNAAANEDAPKDDESEDDVELHRKNQYKTS